MTRTRGLAHEGTIAAGEKLTAYPKLSPGRGFAATVTEFVPGRRMI